METRHKNLDPKSDEYEKAKRQMLAHLINYLYLGRTITAEEKKEQDRIMKEVRQYAMQVYKPSFILSFSHLHRLYMTT